MNSVLGVLKLDEISLRHVRIKNLNKRKTRAMVKQIVRTLIFLSVLATAGKNIVLYSDTEQ